MELKKLINNATYIASMFPLRGNETDENIVDKKLNFFLKSIVDWFTNEKSSGNKTVKYGGLKTIVDNKKVNFYL